MDVFAGVLRWDVRVDFMVRFSEETALFSSDWLWIGGVLFAVWREVVNREDWVCVLRRRLGR